VLEVLGDLSAVTLAPDGPLAIASTTLATAWLAGARLGSHLYTALRMDDRNASDSLRVEMKAFSRNHYVYLLGRLPPRS